MNILLHEKMTEALSTIREKLFCAQSNLIYDYLSSNDPDYRFDHLPYIDEISIGFPNTAGWGTGMEDSMLNAGSLMEVLCLQYEMEKNNDCIIFANQLLKGMEQCTYRHGNIGFVARSISPRDLKTCYINSSRDQFTLCVYGVWRLFKSPLSDNANMRTRASELLSNIASYCERTIDQGNSENLLRLDGRPGLVSSVLNTDVHEIMRLPMFFAAAWDSCKDQHWFKLYRKYAIPGLEINSRMTNPRQWWDIEFVQMQLSLSLLSEVETDMKLKQKYLDLMNTATEIAEPFFHNELKQALELDDFSGLHPLWRALPMRVRSDTLPRQEQSAVIEGYINMMPIFPKPCRAPLRLMQSCGNYMVTMMLAKRNISKELVNRFQEFALKPNYCNHATAGPINIMHGYWLAHRNNIL